MLMLMLMLKLMLMLMLMLIHTVLDDKCNSKFVKFKQNSHIRQQK